MGLHKMKKERQVEEYHICDECKKEIKNSEWYRIFLNERADFCSNVCAVKYRDSFYRIITYDKYPRIIGNTD